MLLQEREWTESDDFPFYQELQAHYDEVQRQLAVTMDQYGIAQRRIQSLTAELEEIRGNLDAVGISKLIFSPCLPCCFTNIYIITGAKS